MKYKLAAFALAIAVLCAQDSPPPTGRPSASVRLLPPDPITGTCDSSKFGWVTVLPEGRRENLTEQEVGRYVMARIHAGYVITLYPQSNGKIWSEAICNNDAKASGPSQ